MKGKGARALGLFLLGAVLALIGGYLAAINILTSGYGLMSGLSPTTEIVTWSDWMPTLTQSAQQSAFGVGAALVVGLMVFVLQLLVWQGTIDLSNASGAQRVLIYTAFAYDFSTTSWTLAGGEFFSGPDAVAAGLRAVMIFAVSVLVFAIGAERSLVWGLQLVTYNWFEAGDAIGRGIEGVFHGRRGNVWKSSVPAASTQSLVAQYRAQNKE